MTKSSRDTLLEMRDFAQAAFEKAVKRMENTHFSDKKQELERVALEAITAYAVADSALSLDRP